MTSQDLGFNTDNIYISVFGPQFKSDSCTLKYAQNIVMIVRVAWTNFVVVCKRIHNIISASNRSDSIIIINIIIYYLLGSRRQFLRATHYEVTQWSIQIFFLYQWPKTYWQLLFYHHNIVKIACDLFWQMMEIQNV